MSTSLHVSEFPRNVCLYPSRRSWEIIGTKAFGCVFLLICSFLTQIYNFQWNDLISHFRDLLWHKVNDTSLLILFTAQSSLLSRWLLRPFQVISICLLRPIKWFGGRWFVSCIETHLIVFEEKGCLCVFGQVHKTKSKNQKWSIGGKPSKIFLWSAIIHLIIYLL